MQGIVAFPGQMHLGDMGCSETTSSNDRLHGGELDSSDPWRRDSDDLGGRRCDRPAELKRLIKHNRHHLTH